MEDNGKDKIKLTEKMQLVVEQMRLDDIEENTDIVNDFFDCSCCGKNACLAGSIQYGDSRLCNDCVLFAEIGFELKKLKNIDDLIKAMEDKKLEAECEVIKHDSNHVNN